MSPTAGATALVLGGGGARGAYQAGVIRGLADAFPGHEFPILTGISSGAINAAFLGAHSDTFSHAAEALTDLWLSVTPQHVYRADSLSLLRNVLRWSWRLVSGGGGGSAADIHSLVDTSPLAQLLRDAMPGLEQGKLAGIDGNIATGRIKAVALSATSYSTGQSVTWIQGKEVELWQRPQRRAELATLGIDHVLASSALPLLFPSVQVNGEWYGDGGIRLTAPLSPALHLGASRILTISTRYPRSRAEADVTQIRGYPPPAQILGVLYNAVFLDLIDQDIQRLQIINGLLAGLPEDERRGMREVEMLVVRPSKDLGMLARSYEPKLPRGIRFLTRGWGTQQTKSADILSLMMFQSDYLRALIELGEKDVESRKDEIARFLDASSAQDSFSSSSSRGPATAPNPAMRLSATG